jgi:DNA-binding MarR family transcriptional regulator
MAAAPKPKEALMPKLTDTQLVILSAAARRQDRAVLPLPKSLKIKGSAVTKTLEGLREKGLLDEKPAARNATAWREDEDGRRMMLVITDAGLQAIDGEPAGESSKEPTPSKARAKKRGGRATRKSAAATTKIEKAQTAVRQGTKQALMIDLLKRKKGATIAEIVAATGWQAHSVRGVISGALKKKLSLTVTSEKVGDRGRVYQIAGTR